MGREKRILWRVRIHGPGVKSGQRGECVMWRSAFAVAGKAFTAQARRRSRLLQYLDAANLSYRPRRIRSARREMESTDTRMEKRFRVVGAGAGALAQRFPVGKKNGSHTHDGGRHGARWPQLSMGGGDPPDVSVYSLRQQCAGLGTRLS